MSKELTDYGFKGLKTIEEVTQEMETKAGTTLLVVNSVCGCAAGGARPGVKMAIQNSSVKPGKMLTVFAGVDKEATDKARSYMLPYPPSSPSIALFKEGQLVHFLERHHIEGKSPEMIAANLKNAIEHYCS